MYIYISSVIFSNNIIHVKLSFQYTEHHNIIIYI
nr:MAG TPA: hypothetical protein [Caudoviricetes sp.]